MEIFDIQIHPGTAIVAHCLFSIIYLGSQFWKRNKWLVLIFISLGLMYVGLMQEGSTLSLGQKILIGNPGFTFLILPSLYFYTLELVQNTRSRYFYWHFLASLVFYLLFLFVEVTPPKDFLNTLSKGDYLPVQVFFFFVLLGSTFYYGQAIFKLIHKNQIKYKEEYAESNIYLTLAWLKYLCFLVFILFGLFAIGLILANFLSDWYFPAWLLELGCLLICMTISFFSFRQPTLYRSIPTLNTTEEQKNHQELAKTSKKLLSESEVQNLSEQLEQLMQQEKPYLHPKIKLADIATLLKVSPYTLSWLLNEHYQKNFFTFINRYRIQEAVRLLQDSSNQHYTLQAISQMAGFQSKTTFNNRFKDIMGMTPSQFKNSLPQYDEIK